MFVYSLFHAFLICTCRLVSNLKGGMCWWKKNPKTTPPPQKKSAKLQLIDALKCFWQYFFNLTFIYIAIKRIAAGAHLCAQKLLFFLLELEFILGMLLIKHASGPCRHFQEFVHSLTVTLIWTTTMATNGTGAYGFHRYLAPKKSLSTAIIYLHVLFFRFFCLCVSDCEWFFIFVKWISPDRFVKILDSHQ